MPRPVTLFTGQWADLPLAELAPLAREMGYDGLELACWGDHFDVTAAIEQPGYVAAKRALLESHGLQCYAISQPPRRAGRLRPHRRAPPGDPAAARVGRRRPRGRAPARPRPRCGRAAEAARAFGVDVVNGFTGSSIWHSIYAFPPTGQDYWDAGFRDFADRWTPILDAFAKHDVRFAPRGAPDRDRVRHRVGPARARGDRRASAVRLQLRPVAPRLPGRRLRQVHPHVRRPHLPRAHEGRVVGPRRRHGRHLRRPHELRRRPPRLGLPLGRPRRRPVRGHHRRAQRHRLPAGRSASSGRTRAWIACTAPPSRRRSSSGSTSRRRTSRSTPPSTGTSSHEAAPLRHGRRRPRRVHRRRAPGRCRARPAGGADRRRAVVAIRTRARDSARDLGLADDRAYGSWQELLDGELARPADDRIDFVVIVTPNDVHYPVAKAVRRGRLPRRLRQAARAHRASRRSELVDARRAHGRRVRRHLQLHRLPARPRTRATWCANGELGELRKVVVQYSQGWLATLARGDRQQAGRVAHRSRALAASPARWATSARTPRTSPRRSPGRHVTQRLRRPGDRRRGPAAGRRRRRAAAARRRRRAACSSRRRSRPAPRTTCASACTAREGSLHWRQEDPNVLVHTPASGPSRNLRRGNDYLVGGGAEGEPHPAGPPGGLHRGVRQRLPRRLRGDPREAGRAASWARSRADSRRSRTARAACASSSA